MFIIIVKYFIILKYVLHVYIYKITHIQEQYILCIIILLFIIMNNNIELIHYIIYNL